MGSQQFKRTVKHRLSQKTVMRVTPTSQYQLQAISKEDHVLISEDASQPILLAYSERTITVFNIGNGKRVKQMSSSEAIRSVACCYFVEYGNCVAALLNYSCLIWSESGQSYSVPLPCRMSSMHAINYGLLFERVDDLGSMNVSFTISSASASIPMYYSLLSPLAIPKPIFQPQEGSGLPDASNISVSELSHVFDVSLNYSVIDLFTTRIDGNQSERDVRILASFPSYNFIVAYNNNTKEHQLIQLCDVHSRCGGMIDPHELMLKELSNANVTMKDSVFDSLNSPDLFMNLLFCGIPRDEPFSSVALVSSTLYFSSAHSVFCYSLSRVSANDELTQPVDLSFIEEHKGVLLTQLKDDSHLLKDAVLIVNGNEWKLVLEGRLLFSQLFSPPEIPPNSVHSTFSSLITFFNPSTACISHISFNSELSESVDSFLATLSHLSSISLHHLSTLTNLEPLVSFFASSTPLPTLHSLCLLLDNAWIHHNTSSLHLLLTLIQRLLSSNSQLHSFQPQLNCSLQCYSSSNPVFLYPHTHP